MPIQSASVRALRALPPAFDVADDCENHGENFYRGLQSLHDPISLGVHVFGEFRLGSVPVVFREMPSIAAGAMIWPEVLRPSVPPSSFSQSIDLADCCFLVHVGEFPAASLWRAKRFDIEGELHRHASLLTPLLRSQRPQQLQLWQPSRPRWRSRRRSRRRSALRRQLLQPVTHS